MPARNTLGDHAKLVPGLSNHVKYWHGGATAPIGRIAGVGIGYTYLDYGQAEGRDVFNLAQDIEQRVGQYDDLGWRGPTLSQNIRHLRMCHGTFADHAQRRRSAMLQVALAQVYAIEQSSSRLAPRLRAGRQLLQLLVQRIVAGGNMFHGHDCSVRGWHATSFACINQISAKSLGV